MHAFFYTAQLLHTGIFRGENNIYLPRRGERSRLPELMFPNTFQKRRVHFSFKTSEFFYGVFFFSPRYYSSIPT